VPHSAAPSCGLRAVLAVNAVRMWKPNAPSRLSRWAVIA
jgi:hypothetical protein